MSAEAGIGGSVALGLKGVAVGAGAGLRSTTVALVGGLLVGNAPPSRGPLSLVRVGGGTARASLNLELFWEPGADFVGAEAGRPGSVVMEVAAAVGGGFLDVSGAP